MTTSTASAYEAARRVPTPTPPTSPSAAVALRKEEVAPTAASRTETTARTTSAPDDDVAARTIVFDFDDTFFGTTVLVSRHGLLNRDTHVNLGTPEEPQWEQVTAPWVRHVRDLLADEAEIWYVREVCFRLLAAAEDLDLVSGKDKVGKKNKLVQETLRASVKAELAVHNRFGEEIETMFNKIENLPAERGGGIYPARNRSWRKVAEEMRAPVEKRRWEFVGEAAGRFFDRFFVGFNKGTAELFDIAKAAALQSKAGEITAAENQAELEAEKLTQKFEEELQSDSEDDGLFDRTEQEDDTASAGASCRDNSADRSDRLPFEAEAQTRAFAATSSSADAKMSIFSEKLDRLRASFRPSDVENADHDHEVQRLNLRATFQKDVVSAVKQASAAFRDAVFSGQIALADRPLDEDQNVKDTTTEDLHPDERELRKEEALKTELSNELVDKLDDRLLEANRLADDEAVQEVHRCLAQLKQRDREGGVVEGEQAAQAQEAKRREDEGRLLMAYASAGVLLPSSSAPVHLPEDPRLAPYGIAAPPAAPAPAGAVCEIGSLDRIAAREAQEPVIEAFVQQFEALEHLQSMSDAYASFHLHRESTAPREHSLQAWAVNAKAESRTSRLLGANSKSPDELVGSSNYRNGVDDSPEGGERLTRRQLLQKYVVGAYLRLRELSDPPSEAVGYLPKRSRSDYQKKLAERAALAKFDRDHIGMQLRALDAVMVVVFENALTAAKVRSGGRVAIVSAGGLIPGYGRNNEDVPYLQLLLQAFMPFTHEYLFNKNAAGRAGKRFGARVKARTTDFELPEDQQAAGRPEDCDAEGAIGNTGEEAVHIDLYIMQDYWRSVSEKLMTDKEDAQKRLAKPVVAPLSSPRASGAAPVLEDGKVKEQETETPSHTFKREVFSKLAREMRRKVEKLPRADKSERKMQMLSFGDGEPEEAAMRALALEINAGRLATLSTRRARGSSQELKSSNLSADEGEDEELDLELFSFKTQLYMEYYWQSRMAPGGGSSGSLPDTATALWHMDLSRLTRQCSFAAAALGDFFALPQPKTVAELPRWSLTHSLHGLLRWEGLVSTNYPKFSIEQIKQSAAYQKAFIAIEEKSLIIFAQRVDSNRRGAVLAAAAVVHHEFKLADDFSVHLWRNGHSVFALRTQMLTQLAARREGDDHDHVVHLTKQKLGADAATVETVVAPGGAAAIPTRLQLTFPLSLSMDDFWTATALDRQVQSISNALAARTSVKSNGTAANRFGIAHVTSDSAQWREVNEQREAVLAGRAEVPGGAAGVEHYKLLNLYGAVYRAFYAGHDFGGKGEGNFRLERVWAGEKPRK
eukprot:g10765.t1